MTGVGCQMIIKYEVGRTKYEVRFWRSKVWSEK